MDSFPFFSIIIPTRDRPELFKKALDSVIAQTFTNKEVIIVNDGSSTANLNVYQDIISQYSNHIQTKLLIRRDNGHGQSYSMNYGVSLAKGRYLCFLDDDDYWTDNTHLQRAHDDITHSLDEIDLYYTNQEAFTQNEQKQQTPVWIEDLIPKLSLDKNSAQLVDVDFLLQSVGFAHLNCSIFRKDFYLALGGMDENIRYECDRDIYLRSIENAKFIMYQPAFIARHNIPNKNNATNMSTQINNFQKKLYQLQVYEKGILNSNNNAIKKLCITGKTYLLKSLAEDLHHNKNNHNAWLYAKQALAIHYSFKWHLFVLYLSIIQMTKR